MKLSVIDNIIWLGQSERVLTLDFHPFHNVLAIGGSQSPYQDDEEASQSYIEEQGYIKLWEYFPDKEKKQDQVKFVRGLQGHGKCVNGLRFSPNGQYLASCSDDNKVKIWDLRWGTKFGGMKSFQWDVVFTLEGHSSEILDIEWSNDGKYLVTCGFDRRTIVWEVEKKKYICVLDGHKGNVKGVAFDPLNKYIVSQGDDRQAKVYKNAKPSNKKKKQMDFMIKNNINRQEYKKKDDCIQSDNEDQDISNVSNLNTATFPLFIQENSLSCFAKRPTWSPDGSLLFLVAAQYSQQEGQKPFPCILGFKRVTLNKPSLVIPTNGFPAICVRFMNKLFKMKPGQQNILDTPYQMIYAVATTETVQIHSTQMREPIAIIGNIHYAFLNDLSWLGSKTLGICSTDGYCSFCNFEEGYFGEEMSYDEIKSINEELANIIIKQSFYSQEDLDRVIEYNVDNMYNINKKSENLIAQPIKIDTNISQNQQVIVTKDDNGNVKKRIKPVMISQAQQ